MADNDTTGERPPAFQFYCRDWLTSQKVMAMSDRAVRAYINLMAHAWLSNPPCELPSDDRVLAALARVGPQGWRRCKDEVLACFETVQAEGGIKLRQPRLYRQFMSTLANRQLKQKAGKQGADKRWKTPENQFGGDSTTTVPPMADHMAKNGSASASASAAAPSPQPPQGGPMAGDGGNGNRRTGGVNCDTCGWVPDHDHHTTCHYCIKKFTPEENYGSKHVCAA